MVQTPVDVVRQKKRELDRKWLRERKKTIEPEMKDDVIGKAPKVLQTLNIISCLLKV